MSGHFFLDQGQVRVEVPVVLNFADRCDCHNGFVAEEFDLILNFGQFLFDVSDFVFVFV